MSVIKSRVNYIYFWVWEVRGIIMCILLQDIWDVKYPCRGKIISSFIHHLLTIFTFKVYIAYFIIPKTKRLFLCDTSIYQYSLLFGFLPVMFAILIWQIKFIMSTTALYHLKTEIYYLILRSKILWFERNISAKFGSFCCCF